MELFKLIMMTIQTMIVDDWYLTLIATWTFFIFILFHLWHTINSFSIVINISQKFCQTLYPNQLDLICPFTKPTQPKSTDTCVNKFKAITICIKFTFLFKYPFLNITCYITLQFLSIISFVTPVDTCVSCFIFCHTCV